LKDQPNELERLAGELLKRGKRRAAKVAEDKLTTVLEELAQEGRRTLKKTARRLILWGDKNLR
jgi:hypothetical protein